MDKIHIDSPNFDPYVLLETLHKDTPSSYLVNAK